MAGHILENEALRIRVEDAGAELCSVFDKRRGTERLWTADPAFWNRHAPILFPFVGKVVDGKYRIGEREYPMKTQHGFARDRDFVCTEETRCAVTHTLCADEASRAIYPYDFRLSLRHALDENDPALLHIEWTVENTGAEPMLFSIGGHPGFLLPEGARQQDCSLYFPGKRALRYFSADPAGFLLPEKVYELETDGGYVPVGDTLCETWIFAGQDVDCVCLTGPERQPWICVHCPDFPILAVWGKEGAPFICLEPWFGSADDAGFRGTLAEKRAVQTLTPGERWQRAYSVVFN